MIGHARERDGIYYLQVPSSQTSRRANYHIHPMEREFGFTITDLDTQHLTLLKFCFLLYFKACVDDFDSDMCELAEHKRVSLPVSTTRSSIPFYAIYSDIWGLSTILNVSRDRWFVSFIDDCTHVTQNFFKTYAIVCERNSYPMAKQLFLLSLAAQHLQILYQWEIKNAFRNCDSHKCWSTSLLLIRVLDDLLLSTNRGRSLNGQCSKRGGKVLG